MLQGTPVYDICTLSDFRQDDIMVSRFAPYLEHHKNLYAAHRHTFYHVVFFTGGAGTHNIDFEDFEVKPGQIYFMVPGQVHSWSFEGFTDGYIINFSDTFFQSLLLDTAYLERFAFFSGDVSEAVINLPAGAGEKIGNLFEEIIKEWESSPKQTTDLMRVLMLQVFILVNRFKGANPKGPASYNQTLLKNFRKLIEQQYKKLRLPKDYAALLYITPNHLNAVCKDLLGKQAGELIRNRALLEAKRLLTNPELTITEIAMELNFGDNSYFTKFFKKTEGITPEEFRKNILTHNHHD
ncbi:helix-turn-helix domain-containing protein [Mucilaginibacter xinganensis]|uniref:AraC family transcriptional regulator n=1 Tax=Mucilaginibacter xinganensis TaxID=1234841 RepID=A0A223P0N2_9SPHI|nr:helix-turn-helix domain-containing protein [Mucilaginibacter xinganensis]ASU35657.1 AraC family transcriptional regulator [Mucilaginibacter xinganensis]